MRNRDEESCIVENYEKRRKEGRKEIGEKRLPLLAATDSNTVPDGGNMVARDATHKPVNFCTSFFFERERRIDAVS